MRRSALLGLSLLLPGALTGCSGFGHFLDDTFTLSANHNAPIGDAENLRRARGQTVDIKPLLTEPGDVWPGPLPRDPTLSDLESDQNRTTRMLTGTTDVPQAGIAPPAPAIPARMSPDAGPKTYDTPGGPLHGKSAPGAGYQSLTRPDGVAAGIAIPNGNGTSTIIAPDGGVTTAPTPK